MELFSPEYRNKSQKEILIYLKKNISSMKNNRQIILNLIKFMESGGKIKIKLITLENIKNEIKKGNPPIILIERKSLYGKGIGEKPHFVIPVEISKNYVKINDPSWEFGGVKKYSPEKILYAFYRLRGIALFINRK